MDIKIKAQVFFISLLVTGPLFADNAPPCPPLSSYNINDVNNNLGFPWSAFLNGPNPMSTGVIVTTASDGDSAKKIATNAQAAIQPHGNAQLICWPDGSGCFWSCSDVTGNYNLIQGVTHAFVSSNNSQQKSINRHTQREQFELMRRTLNK